MNKISLWQTILLVVCIITMVGIFPLVSPECQNINNEQYDFIIISPTDFSEELVPLVDHKEQHSISTKIVTLDEIYKGKYFPANGRDDSEKIKYFIKDVKENWNISYVMLVGGKEELPIRYVDECYWGEHREYISDLYYADIFDANGSFCSWDSNNDNTFSGKNMNELEDEVDLYPDVSIGRLLCRKQSDVKNIVGKIIDYETNTYGKQWFDNLIVCGGDDARLRFREKRFPDYFNRDGGILWEGEKIGEQSHKTKFFDTCKSVSHGTSKVSTIDVMNNENWRIERVDATGQTGRYTSIALDSHGYPHISYCQEDSGGFVRYAKWNGIDWEIETIDTGSGGEFGNVTTTSIAIDSEDNPHIVYAKPPNMVKYAQWDENQWKYDTVISKEGIYGSVSIALDSQQHPHISYCDGYDSYHIWHAYHNGTSWSNEIVDPQNRGGIHNTICTDSNDAPCIAYTSVSKGAIYCAKKDNNNGDWYAEIVDSATNKYYFYPSLDLDSNDHPHIGYYDIESYDLKYAKQTNTDGEWEVTCVVSDEIVGYSYSLALSKDNQPHFMYQELQEKKLCYIFWDEDNWKRTVIDSDGDVGCCSSIVLDKNDLACISYRDEELGDLKFARNQAFSLKYAKPEGAIYLMNTKICGFITPVIVGSIDLCLSVVDNQNDVASIDIYIDNEFQVQLNSEPYEWTWSDLGFGSYLIKSIACDSEGNQVVHMLNVWKFF